MKQLHNKFHKKYLLLPIAVKQPLKDVSIYADGKLIYEFSIPISNQVGNYEFQYYAPVFLEGYEESIIEAEGDVGEAFWEAVCFSDSVPWKADSHPAIHFSANTGWLNDPNGFFFQDGSYHLYFQHNPFDTLWGNMSWGHAVSTDLLHWEQQDTVLYPDEDGTIFSGCALVDEKGHLTFFYTSAGNQSHWSRGKKFTQKIAYSSDGGRSIAKTGIAAVPHIAGDNRDPKVYWHEESNGYFMVLYLEKNEFAILRSVDLVKWEVTQRLSFEGAWECPDLIRVPVEGGGKRWLFWCADGFCFPGDFDGYTFTQTGEKMQAYAASLPYAAQTCWGADRVISIPWLRTGNEGHTYTGLMGIPRELSLVEQNNTLKLRQRLIREVAACRKEIAGCISENAVLYNAEAEPAVELTIDLKKEKDFTVFIGLTKIQYDSESRKLEVYGCRIQTEEAKWRKAEKTQICGGSGQKEIMFDEDPDTVSILADHEILEITVNDGMVCAAFEIQPAQKQQSVEITVNTKGQMRCYQIS